MLIVKWKGKFYQFDEDDYYIYMTDLDESLKYQKEVVCKLDKSAKKTANCIKELQIITKDSLKEFVVSQLNTIKA